MAGSSYCPGLPVQATVVVGSGGKGQTTDRSGQSSMESLVNRQSSIRDQACQASRQISMTSLGTCGPMCRICHSLADKEEALISPCRCLGTLKYVHMSCLVHWLEISCRKLRKPPQCELCGYRYQRHKILNLKNCNWPKCSTKDLILHVIFIISVITMIVCAAVTIVCFKADSGRQQDPNQPVELTAQEVVTLICGIMFFCGFFIAMYVQVKAKVTLYKWLMKFWMINHEWFIDEYRPSADPEWIKKNRLIREQLAAAASGAAGGACCPVENEESEQREPFLKISVEEGSDVQRISTSVSRRSSLSSVGLEFKELDRREEVREEETKKEQI